MRVITALLQSFLVNAAKVPSVKYIISICFCKVLLNGPYLRCVLRACVYEYDITSDVMKRKVAFCEPEPLRPGQD